MFCTFLPIDDKIYYNKLQRYFPRENSKAPSSSPASSASSSGDTNVDAGVASSAVSSITISTDSPIESQFGDKESSVETVVEPPTVSFATLPSIPATDEDALKETLYDEIGEGGGVVVLRKPHEKLLLRLAPAAWMRSKRSHLEAFSTLVFIPDIDFYHSLILEFRGLM